MKKTKKTESKAIAPPPKDGTSKTPIYYVKDKNGNIVKKTVKKKK